MDRNVSPDIELFKSIEMKAITLIITLFFTLIARNVVAQQVIFPTLGNARHIVAVQSGFDHGSYYGMSYGYVLKGSFMPMVIGTEITIPFGNDIMDDWKWKSGVETALWQRGSFAITFKPSIIDRRYESPLVRLYNFGIDFALSAGYVQPRWGVVAVAGFDKAVVTHFKHGLLRDYYPEIQDGWFLPTGGHFRFGARVHYSVGRWTAFMLAGRQYGQDFSDNPTAPWFGEVAFQRSLGR
jgi:hypothetical protein